MGFNYKEWDGPFYPAGLPARQHLSYYAERFNALEMDSTYYGTPSASAISRWAEVTPPEFKICPKMPNVITHEKRLLGAEVETDTFLTRIRLLGENLGPILLQFPPDFTIAQIGSLVKFLPLLPDDLRFAVEFRHRSWEKPESSLLLQNHRISWAAVDYVYMPHKIERTTDFLFLRFLGPRGRFRNKDREMIDRSADLQEWSQRLTPQLPHIDHVYAFFNDDFSGFAPASANHFKDLIGLEPGDIRPLQQGRLF